MKPDIKSFEVLEQKIKRTVEFVTRLKDENATLIQKVSRLEGTASDFEARSHELETARITAAQLEEEVGKLKDERHAVISRVDSLLQNLDQLQLD